MAAMRRAGVLSSHLRCGDDRSPATATAAAAPPAALPAASGGDGGPAKGAVSFDGTTFRKIEPLSRPGRGAYPDQDECKDADGYLRVRRAAETGASQLWRIHGKLYDLTPYLDAHPGGRTWLELMRGCDATEAFEAHHLDGARAERIIKAFYVRDVRPGEFARGDRFTYDEAGFYRTLRRRVLQRLRDEAGAGAAAKAQDVTGPTPAMLAASAACVAQFLGAHAVARSTGSRVAAAAAGYFLIGCWGVGHNFMHQAERKGWLWQRVMDLSGPPAAPVADFRVTHALSHHLFPNLANDFETCNYTSQGPYSYTNEDNTVGNLYPLAPVGAPILALLGGLFNAVKMAVAGSGRAAVHLVPLLNLLSYVRGRGSTREGLLLCMLQFGTYGAAFLPWGLSPHHCVVGYRGEGADLQTSATPRDTFSWREGQPGAQADFGAHQVAATEDHSIMPKSLPGFLANYLSLTCFGYLNDHTLHHLFPSVDHSRFPIIREVFEQTAKEFGVEYKPRSRGAMAVGLHRWFRNRVFRPEAHL